MLKPQKCFREEFLSMSAMERSHKDNRNQSLSEYDYCLLILHRQCLSDTSLSSSVFKKKKTHQTPGSFTDKLSLKVTIVFIY